jgi:hypothetical protein
MPIDDIVLRANHRGEYVQSHRDGDQHEKSIHSPPPFAAAPSGAVDDATENDNETLAAL